MWTQTKYVSTAIAACFFDSSIFAADVIRVVVGGVVVFIHLFLLPQDGQISVQEFVTFMQSLTTAMSMKDFTNAINELLAED